MVGECGYGENPQRSLASFDFGYFANKYAERMRKQIESIPNETMDASRVIGTSMTAGKIEAQHPTELIPFRLA
jgi:hypothetical protein